MRAWIFQGKPDRYDVADPETVKEGRTEIWLASRYHDQMKPGDLVYLWRSGKADRRGVYAWGVITGEPQYYDDWGWGVPVEYRKRLPDHIPATVVAGNDELSEHLLFRMPIGTNFELTTKQAVAMRDTVTTVSGIEFTPPEDD